MTRNTSCVSVKYIPQRTCVACRKIRAKQELIRLVRISDDGIESVEVNIGGKKAGRGAYLCPSAECWETGLKRGRLEYSLGTKLTQDNREQLLRFGKDFLKE